MTTIAENLRRIREQITCAAARANRLPTEIKLVAVSKRFSAAKITEALAAGQTVFGENYIQELAQKRPQTPPSAIFHFVGHLQSNKAKVAAATCDMIETVDGIKLARVLNGQLDALNRSMDVLLQVNVGDDTNKAGVKTSEAEALLRQLNDLPRLRVCGLMTMPPLVAQPELSRPYFRSLRQLAESLMARGLFPAVEKPELSMGMSGDFHIAIEEGATIVRIGTAIFGERIQGNEQ